MTDFMNQRRYLWGDERNVLVYELLAEACSDIDDTKEIARAAKVPMPEIASHANASSLWRIVLESAAESETLSMLVVKVMMYLTRTKEHETQERLQQLLDDPPAEAWSTNPASDPGGERWAVAFLGSESSDDDREGTDCDRARELLRNKFCDPRSSTYRPIDPEKIYRVEEIVPNAAFRFDLEYSGERSTAQLYLGLPDEIGGVLWAQEASSLVRLSAHRHLALPRVLDGLVRDRENIGLIVSTSSGEPLDLDVVRKIRADRSLALRCFGQLVDALRHIHSHTIVHRSIWRGALEVLRNTNDDPAGLRLARFEMSIFLSSLLDRTPHPKVKDRTARRREFHLQNGVASLLACPPEQLKSLLGTDNADAGTDFLADIYSLGIVAYELFIGDLPVQEFASELGDRRDRVTSDRIDRACRVLDQGAREATDVPERLRDLIRRMLRPWPGPLRPTASQILGDLARFHDQIEKSWSRDTQDRAFVVSIAPDLVLEHAKLQSSNAIREASAEVRFEILQERIEKDLSPSSLLHEPMGATNYIDGGSFGHKEQSVYVLIGTANIYFCQAHTKGTETLDWVLHIAYIVDKNHFRVQKLGSGRIRRPVPAIRVVHYRKSGDVDHRLGPRQNPLWPPLLQAVVTQEKAPSWHAAFKEGLQWWLKLQRAQSDNRLYAFERFTPSSNHRTDGTRIVYLRVRLDEDRWWIEQTDELRHIVARDGAGRPAFGDFFDTLEERGFNSLITWVPDRGGKPDLRKAPHGTPEVRVRQRLNAQEIEIEVLSSDYVPARGWLRPKDDVATDVLLRRQIRAQANLHEHEQLMEAMYEPWSLRASRIPWKDAGAGLSEEGRSRQILKDMLATFPFFALHGPPGTGKTTIVSTALDAYLQRYGSARILVSAQSHYALDELASRIQERLDARSASGAKDQPVLIRLFTRDTAGQARESLRTLGDAEQADECVRRIATLSYLSGQETDTQKRTADPAVVQIAREWQRASAGAIAEIRDHLWRGANVVFATCGSCTDGLLDTYDQIDRFDWVIVEEAGKAWPVELTMALIHGRRWTLIGDPKQLPAYGKDDVERIYDRWAQRQQLSAPDSGARDEAFLATFDIFGRLFDRARKAKDPTRWQSDEAYEEMAGEQEPNDAFRHRLWPVDRLDVGYRMHENINTMVSRCFYEGDIKTWSELRDRNPEHGVDRPRFLQGRALVWLDTGRVPRCRHERRRWSNEGEIDVLVALLEQGKAAILGPEVSAEGRLAILSAYHDQNRLLRGKLPSDVDGSLIHTTDSFQGREADIVVISLVRTNENQGSAMDRIGHLGDDRRVNVLLSRAKELLILIGDFEHFEKTLDSKWPEVCRIIEQLGGRIRSREVSALLGEKS